MLRFRCRQLAVFLIAVAAAAGAAAGEQALQWTEPTQNEDGSPLTDLSHYEVHHGCTTPGAYSTVETVNPPATTYTVTGLPDSGFCYFALRAVNQAGVVSQFSGELAVDMASAVQLPGVVQNLAVTWQETPQSNSVTISIVGSGTVGGTGSTVTITHGLTINSGDKVVVYVNSNSTTAISANADSGGAWTELIDERPDAAETSWHALYDKDAATEPSSWSFAVGSAEYRAVWYVLRTDKTWADDLAASSAYYSSNALNIRGSAANGRTVAPNSISLVFGGKDNRSGAGAYTTATQSHTGVEGDAGDQCAAGAYRISTSGYTIGGDIELDNAGSSDFRNDKSYSVHLSYKEVDAVAANPAFLQRPRARFLEF